ncbi:hypothetical protein PsorP6_015265 [Peronosclerospora sorghi]|uniref:Uncharacterized protein n=1 Tax=Peronosclerospora sorghi TaxID=230839 RepID=A0ACC0VU53_9STRA|nr:hypothetical protein PsorP6_015265 [Peronosclerospora sorghi]
MKVSELLQRLQSFPRTELVSTFVGTKPNSVGALLAGFFDYYVHRFNLEDEVLSVRTGKFKRASDLLSEDHRIEDICVSDETSWNQTATRYICCGRDHATRECGRLVRQHSTPGGACNAMSLFSDY